MPKQKFNYLESLPTIRIVLIDAAELYYAEHYSKEEFVINNPNSVSFDKHYKDLMPPNLDLIHLAESKKLTLGKVGDEYYTDDFVNVMFKYSLRVNEKGERVFKDEEADKEKGKDLKEIRKSFYLFGFIINGQKYVRYKRSAGSAKSGSCLFIKEQLYKQMNKWSQAGLNEDKDKNCLNNLTSYEAYKALSLSSLIHTFKLNPYNILFVDDFDKYDLADQDVIKVDYAGEKDGLVAKREKCTVKDVNLFDGEGLMDTSVFTGKFKNKGMMLLRNRYFKCCAFHTKLQKWFEYNHITDVNQLNGFTFAKDIRDIVLVVSKSCLKYVKLAKEGFTKECIERWCKAVSDKNNESIFGVVKTDKKTRFFDGDMVETTYQLLNTLELPRSEIRKLIAPYVDYIKKIRNIKETPEFVRFFLDGEVVPFEEDYEDDSEEPLDEDDLFNYSSYSFKNKICADLLKIDSKILNTELFKQHIFNDIIASFRLKLYGGRVLVNGTYATLFGNPIEYLKYIILKDGKSLFNKDNVTSCLGKDQIYCPFFKDNEELVGSRAPHTTMGNVLLAKNTKLSEVDKWFKLSRNIVVVDAINNNIQQRLNGADYDSDTMLLTNNHVLVNAAKKNYHKFPVPYVAFGPDTSKPKEKITKVNHLSKLFEIDSKIANNKTGEIVNLSQQLNSHLWHKREESKKFNDEELYGKIAILAALAGAEIDSSKRAFPFSTTKELARVRAYINDEKHLYQEPPKFFYFVRGKENGETPRCSEIEKYVASIDDKEFFKTAMDTLWGIAKIDFSDDSGNLSTIPFFDLIRDDIKTTGLSKTNYKDQIKPAVEALIRTKNVLNKEKLSRRKSTKYEEEKREFQRLIKTCYQKIKVGINTLKKVKVVFRKIEESVNKPYSTLYILLYIICMYEKELDYTFSDLFNKDGGIPGMYRVSMKKDNIHVLFNKYYYALLPNK